MHLMVRYHIPMTPITIAFQSNLELVLPKYNYKKVNLLFMQGLLQYKER